MYNRTVSNNIIPRNDNNPRSSQTDNSVVNPGNFEGKEIIDFNDGLSRLYSGDQKVKYKNLTDRVAASIKNAKLKNEKIGKFLELTGNEISILRNQNDIKRSYFTKNLKNLMWDTMKWQTYFFTLLFAEKSTVINSLEQLQTELEKVTQKQVKLEQNGDNPTQYVKNKPINHHENKNSIQNKKPEIEINATKKAQNKFKISSNNLSVIGTGDESNAKIKELNKQLGELKNRNVSLEANLKGATEKAQVNNTNKDSKIAELKKRVEEETSKNEKLNENIRNQNDRLNQESEKINELEKKNKELLDHIEKDKEKDAEIKRLNEEIEKLKFAKSNLKIYKNDDITIEKGKSKNGTIAKTKEISYNVIGQKKFKKLEQTNNQDHRFEFIGTESKTKNDLENAKLENDELNKTVAQLNSQVEQLKNEITLNKEKLDNAAKEGTTSKKGARKELKLSTGKTGTSTNRIADLEKQINDLKYEITNLRTINNSLRESLENAGQEKKKLLEKVHDLEYKLNRLENENKKLDKMSADAEEKAQNGPQNIKSKNDHGSEKLAMIRKIKDK